MKKRAFTHKPIIDGQDVDTGVTFRAVNPSTGEPFADVVRAGPAEIDAAVASARKAFLSWSRTPVAARQKQNCMMAFAIWPSAESSAGRPTMQIFP